MLLLLLGTHLFYTFRLHFVQRHVFRGIRYSLGKEEKSSHAGSSESKHSDSKKSFSSLATILAATIGIGNIVGVSTAIALGGPGAVLWCWLTGILGMATSYAECYLSLYYRKKQPDGSYRGGPMYVLQYGLHCLPLAILFALLTTISSLGVGCTIQANSAAEAAAATFHIPPAITGLILAILAGYVLIGGADTIRKVCTWLVPAMGLFFLVSCFFLLILNRNYIVKALLLILKSAFVPQAATGGFVGSTILTAARFGVARGLFTNEAGLGSAPIAAASSPASSSLQRSALISMTAVFWDTIVLCAVTGIAIVTHMLRFPESCASLSPTALTSAAFATIPYIGTPMLTLSIIAFSFATILGWYYFGEYAFLYLLGIVHSHDTKKDSTLSLLKAYQIVYMVMIFLGSIQASSLVWELTDFINACMAFPNLLCLLLLWKKIPILSGDNSK